MSKVRPDQPLIPSFLDRLIDDNPGSQKEQPASRNQVLRQMKKSVQRDLERLLNTRWRCVSWPPDLEELELSLVNYGIPDFTGASMSAPSDRAELCQIIERVIRTFETRFKTVTVKLVENRDEFDRTLRFRIDALMYSEPAPEPVVFDTQLEPSSTHFEVKSQ
jgi:type VI secretion system protein ImpF